MADQDAFVCSAYGPDGRDAGAICFVSGEPGKRVCTSAEQCHEVMTAERQRVWQRIQDGAARGDPDLAFLAGEFSDPSQLLGGGQDEDGDGDGRG